MCAYGRKWARVFLCLGRQRGRKALYLGQTSLHSGRAQSLFYFGFFPLPRGSGVNRCSHTPARRGGPSPASPAPAAAQPLPCFQAAALLNEGPWVPAGTGLRGLWRLGRGPQVCTSESHQLRSGRRTGSALGSTRAGWSCGRPPNGDATPFPSQ